MTPRRTDCCRSSTTFIAGYHLCSMCSGLVHFLSAPAVIAARAPPPAAPRPPPGLHPRQIPLFP